MTDETASDESTGRRTFLKGVAAASAAAAASGTASAETESLIVDDDLSAATGQPQEALVVFKDDAETDRLEALGVEWYHEYDSFAVVWTVLTGDQVLEVAGWESVLRVSDNYTVQLENNDSQKDTGAREVWESEDLGYTGTNVNVSVVDSGIDATHPGMENVEANYAPVGEPADEEPTWVDAGTNANVDEYGHGTHCMGSLAGTGAGSLNADYTGMAPDATFTSYEAFDDVYLGTATAVGLAGGPDELVVGVARILGAYDDIIRKHREGERECHLVSNSWGAGPGTFDPYDPIAIALWEAFEEGILSVFSAGNDGSDLDTLGILKHAPFVLSVAAANADQTITGFSSRGKFGGNYDRKATLEAFREAQYDPVAEPDDEAYGAFQLERPGVVAKGGGVVSAQSPESLIYGLGATTGAQSEPLYAPASGTSMACPTTGGVIALFLDAYIEEHGEVPDPMDTINTIEATANETAHPMYTTVNAGAGYVDAVAAVQRAVEDDLADFDEVELAEDSERPRA